MNSIKLINLDKDFKFFLSCFLFTMLIGIFLGLGFIYYTTDMNIQGTIEHYNGSEILDNEIPEEFPKPMEAMILTTHAHVNSFALISLIIGTIFYFNSIISGKIKLLLMVEPFFGTLITFLSMWFLRYLNESFVYLVLLSGFLMYLFWIIMVVLSLYELLFKK